MMGEGREQELQQTVDLLNRTADTLETQNKNLEEQLQKLEDKHAVEQVEAEEAAKALNTQMAEQRKSVDLMKVKSELADLTEDQLSNLTGETVEELTKSGKAILDKQIEQEAAILKKHGLDADKIMNKTEETGSPMNIVPASNTLPPTTPTLEVDAAIENVLAWKNVGQDGKATDRRYNCAEHIGLTMEQNKLASG